jgi:hypothetical protein
VAAQSDAVHAVAPFEPVILSVMDEQVQAALGDAVARTGELAAEGRLTAAVRAFLGWLLYDEEIAVAEDAGYVEAAGRYVTNLLNFLQQVMAHGDPAADPISRQGMQIGTVKRPSISLKVPQNEQRGPLAPPDA